MSKAGPVSIKKSHSDALFDIVNYGMCIVIFIIIVYPLYFVVIASFSDPDAIARGEVWLWPKGINFSAYEQIFRTPKIWVGYYNTIIYTAGATFFSLFFTLPAAYALSRKDFLLRKPFTIFFLIPMFFNGGLIPTYLQIKKLGLLDTYWVMVIPFSVNIFHVIIAKTFYSENVPDELRQAAEIDGCSTTRFFIQIVLPITKAIIAVIGLYVAVANWNGYMNALIYLKDPNKKPLQIVLRSILIQNERESGSSVEALRRAEMLKYGLIIVSTLPIMCVYPFIQKYFTKGVLIGSIKA